MSLAVPMALSASFGDRQSPFSSMSKDRIYIVNSHYNHYGQSVLRPHSRSSLSSANNSAHDSLYSFNQRHKKPKLMEQDPERERENTPDESFALGEVEDVDVAMTGVAKSKPKIFNYKSLINPDNKVKRFLNRLDPDAFSMFSTSSKPVLPLATINTLPLEVLRLIVSYTKDYRTRVSCLYVNKNFYQAAKMVIYESPFLTSTYRVAQLVSCLKENRHNGKLIKHLDLSNLSTGVITKELSQNEDEDGDDVMGPEVMEYALASWRDWKYRDDPLYGSPMLNSYTLSKTKSNMSCDSTASMGSSFSKMMLKWKLLNPSALEVAGSSMKESMKKIFKWRKKKLRRKRSKKVQLNKVETSDTQKEKKSVKFGAISDPKLQPFAVPHPYTNKFLLKYAGSKDLPIGYVLYLIDLCPNLHSFNLSQLTLSTDFSIVYPEQEQPQYPKVSSLIDNVLDDFVDEDPDGADTIAHYLSDANAYFNMKSYNNEFVKLYELDILKHLATLQNLESLQMSSLTWLNYRNMRQFVQTSKSIEVGKLKWVDMTNSGMIRELRWAKKFDNLDDLKEYFQNEIEPVEEVENPHDSLIRTIGMNY